MKPTSNTDREATHLRASGRVQNKTILIVDDDQATLDLHARILRGHSATYHLLKARNGLEALELLRQTHVDLVLLDLRMPELDGFGVLEAMWEGEITRHIPVIVLTAQVLNESDMNRLDHEVIRVLEKGLFGVGEMLAHVEESLARSHLPVNDKQRVAHRAMAYFNTYFAEPDVSQESAAFSLGVSEDFLQGCFKKETGVTPIVYLNRCRISQAKALLVSGRQSVAEVARAVGFSDRKYFERVFQREVGVSPSTYREAGMEKSGG